MKKKPSELYEDGTVELKDLEEPKICAECGEKFNQYIWSPHFCPDCDLIRMDRVDGQMREIMQRVEE